MPGALYLVDSNVLLRWIKRMIAITRWWFRPSKSPFRTMLSCVTHPRMLGSSGTPAPGHSSATDTVCLRKRPTGEPLFSSASCDCCRISLAVHQEWRRLLVTHNVSGVQVHDARLVAAMRVHAVKRVLTFNEKDFARYPGIEAVHPRSLAAETR